MSASKSQLYHNNKYNLQAIRLEVDGYIRFCKWKTLRSRLQAMDLELRRAVIEMRPGGNHREIKKNTHTPTLLHALCDRINSTPPVPFDLLELAVEACQHLLSAPSAAKSPLAMMLDRQASPRILECLLSHDTSRRSLYRHNNKTGDTPLLQAIKQHASDEVILLLVGYDTTKESLLIPSKKRDRVPLYYVANHELSFVHLGPEDMPGELEYMLLQTHQALRIQRGELTPDASTGIPRRGMDDVMDDLDGSSGEDLILEEDLDGEGHAVEEWILDDEGTGDQSEEQYSLRLLHAVLACAHFLGSKHALNLLSFLLSRISNFSLSADKEGNTILHHLCQATHVFSQSTLLEGRFMTETILEKHPNSAVLPNFQGDLPLHVALKAAKPWRDVIATLIDARPETVSAENTVNGRLPLHLAILHYPSGSGVIHGIWKLYPEAATVPDPLTRLFPFQLAALPDKLRAPTSGSDPQQEEASDIYMLLKESPQVLRSCTGTAD